MRLTIETVKQELFKFTLHYPEAGHNGKTLALLAQDYHEDLVHEQVTEELFLKAVKLARRRCGYFPKIGEILDAAKDSRSSAPPVLKIEDNAPLSEEERVSAKKHLAAIDALLNRASDGMTVC